MEYTKAPIINNPIMLDAAIGNIQQALVLNFDWLDAAFGRAQFLAKVLPNGKRIVTPNVYCGGLDGHGENDYIEVSPDSGIGNFAFFVVDDPQNWDWEKQVQMKQRAPFALIFWFDTRRVFGEATNRNTEMLKSKILELLNGRSGWLLRNGSIRINKCYEKAQNIYRGFSLDEVDNQFLMHPYAGFRFEGEIEVEQPCDYVTPAVKLYDTRDATVIASDIAAGQIGYGANGRLVGTGELTRLIEANVTPSTEQQTILPDVDHNGFSLINVAPVTAEIDANIKPENIVKDVEILGVTGNVVKRNEYGNTGTVDAEGLRELGWNENDIAWLQKVCWWDEEDNEFWKVTDANKEFGPNGATPIHTKSDVNAHINDENLRYIPKLNDRSNAYGKYSVALATDGYGKFADNTYFPRLVYHESIRSVGDLSKIDFSNATNNLGFSPRLNFRAKFHIDTSKIVDGLYQNDARNIILVDISDWDVSSYSNLNFMPLNCTEIGDISNWDTHNFTSFYNAFIGRLIKSSLNLNNWDTSNVTDMRTVFNGICCVGVPTDIIVDRWDTSRVTTMNGMFAAMVNVNKIGIPPIPHGCDTNNMFQALYSVTGFREIQACGKISQSISFNYTGIQNLSRESLLVVINALDADNPGTLTLHTNQKSQLTASDIAIATNKGWTIA